MDERRRPVVGRKLALDREYLWLFSLLNSKPCALVLQGVANHSKVMQTLVDSFILSVLCQSIVKRQKETCYL